MTTATPLVGVVVPSYRQPGLMAEALDCLIQQTYSRWCAVVVVDGCPYADTRLTAASYGALDDRIEWVMTPNRGLSAARNRGIDYLLAKHPDVEFIYFLDADNRLQPRALELYLEKATTSPDADWVYPNLSMFGTQRAGGFDASHVDFAVPFRNGRLLVENICDAGSLVRAEVLRQGLRFAEGMRHGFEDWEFFRHAAQRSHGVPGGFIGFRYRRRVESMLTESKRGIGRGLAGELLEHTSAAREPLWAQIRAFNEEFPVAVVGIGEAVVDLIRTFPVGGSAADKGDDLSYERFCSVVSDAILDVHALVPARTIVLADDAGRELLKTRAAPAIVFRLEQMLASQPLAYLRVVAGNATRDRDDGARAHLVAMDIQTFLNLMSSADESWVAEALTGFPADVVGAEEMHWHFESEHGAATTSGFGEGCLACVLDLKQQVNARVSAAAGPRQRVTSVLPDLELMRRLQARLNGPGHRVPVVLSPADEGRGVVAVAVPFCRHGGVERVTAALAAELRAAGYVVILFITDGGEIPEVQWVLDSFDAIVPLFDQRTRCSLGTRLPPWDDPSTEWEGHRLPDPAPYETAPGLGVLGVGRLLIIEHSLTALARAAVVRRRGVRVATHLHVFDRSRFARPVGHAWLALAYEHVLDLFICSSPYWLDLMTGLGVPRDKCVLVRNAPFAKGLAERAPSNVPRVLFVGRSGPQKGYDTFLRIWGSLQDSEVEWTVVTEQTGSHVPSTHTEWRAAEPDIGHVIHANDILLLTSDWEGIPLIALEALNAGKTVLAPDLLPLADDIRSPRLITLPRETFEVGAVSVIRNIRQIADQLGEATDSGPGYVSWHESAHALVAWCEENLDAFERMPA